MRRFLCILTVWAFFACKKDAPNRCLYDSPVTNLQQAQRELVGEWQLTSISAMTPSTSPVPDVRLRFGTNGEVEVTENGVFVGKVGYAVSETPYGLTLRTEESILVISQNLSVFSGHLRLCKSELLVDIGMAGDLPAYFFTRLK